MNIHNRKAGFTLIELFMVLTIIAILCSLFTGRVNFSHGSGEKIGQVVKLSKEGFIRDTWEGQLIRGGMNGGSGAFGTVPFNFTVETDEMAKEVEDYLKNQTEVVITYRIEGIYSPFRSGSQGHFLVSIKPQRGKDNVFAQ